jgi:hypothetical protein
MTAYVPQEVEAAGKTCDLSGVLDIRECLMEEEINSKKRLKLLRCTGRTLPLYSPANPYAQESEDIKVPR